MIFFIIADQRFTISNRLKLFPYTILLNNYYLLIANGCDWFITTSAEKRVAYHVTPIRFSCVLTVIYV